MEKKLYQKPDTQVLKARLDEMMFTPGGGGISNSDPGGTPVVTPAKPMFEPHHYSPWDD